MVWHIVNGTVINAATVIVGSVGGLMIGGKLPERYRTIVIQSLGLVTITLGIDAAVLEFARTADRLGAQMGSPTYGARIAMVMISCLIVGVLIGTWLRLHERIESFGHAIHQRYFKNDGTGSRLRGDSLTSHGATVDRCARRGLLLAI